MTAKKAHDDLAYLNSTMATVLADAVANKNSITGLYISANEKLDKYQLDMVKLHSVNNRTWQALVIDVAL